ncbi:RNA methyltransferase [Metallosphaera tengchongensis]|uniref:tRNA (guanine(10)-N(2))-dimethyltransferase n=2 Tax=Metallosphaera tengchongensis TaxID=1532350 RepID=A0A6N0NXL4_9CREN|nr:RNA methyltransferase [Metallosphaera tengchongensis]
MFTSMAELRALVEGEVHFLTGVGLFQAGGGIARRSSTIKAVGEVVSISSDPGEVNKELRGKCFSIQPDVILGVDKASFKSLYGELVEGVKTSRECQKLDLIYTDGVLIAGLREEERDSKSLLDHSRKPFSQSGTMDPYTSRLMVNLAKPSGKVLDPFAGLGSILIEASWMGFSCYGLDVEVRALEKARTNLNFFGLNCELSLGSATSLPFSGKSAVVTDPPYGRSSNARGMKLRELYEGFFYAVPDILEGRLVFATDSNLDWRDQIRSAGMRVLSTHYIYLHKSLSRAIYVVEK